ncbi:MAG: peptidylprolyl isomerase [Nitrospirae bacterium]|nr:peptidylprolyl isomerase [Nitrospirota bacterium]
MRGHKVGKVAKVGKMAKMGKVGVAQAGVVLKSLLCAAAFAGLILIIPAVSSAIMLDQIVAMVDKEVITWSELYKAMEFDLKDKVRDMSSKERLEFLKKYEKEFLERLIEVKLQLMYAEAAHITIADKEVDAAIEDMMGKYSLTKEQFKDALKKEGFTFDEYRKRLSDQILLQKVGNVIMSEKVVVTDNEIAQHSKSSKLEKGPMKYRLRLILISKKDDKEENLLAKKKAEDVYGYLMKGVDFRTMASQFSDDPTAGSGGDLGYVSADDMSKELLPIVEGMKEGDISRIFLTPRGFNIVQLLDKRAIDTDEKLYSEVRSELLEQKAKRVYKDWIKSLKEKHFIKIIL